MSDELMSKSCGTCPATTHDLSLPSPPGWPSWPLSSSPSGGMTESEVRLIVDAAVAGLAKKSSIPVTVVDSVPPGPDAERPDGSLWIENGNVWTFNGSWTRVVSAYAPDYSSDGFKAAVRALVPDVAVDLDGYLTRAEADSAYVSAVTGLADYATKSYVDGKTSIDTSQFVTSSQLDTRLSGYVPASSMPSGLLTETAADAKYVTASSVESVVGAAVAAADLLTVSAGDRRYAPANVLSGRGYVTGEYVDSAVASRPSLSDVYSAVRTVAALVHSAPSASAGSASSLVSPEGDAYAVLEPDGTIVVTSAVSAPGRYAVSMSASRRRSGGGTVPVGVTARSGGTVPFDVDVDRAGMTIPMDRSISLYFDDPDFVTEDTYVGITFGSCTLTGEGRPDPATADMSMRAGSTSRGVDPYSATLDSDGTARYVFQLTGVPVANSDGTGAVLTYDVVVTVAPVAGHGFPVPTGEVCRHSPQSGGGGSGGLTEFVTVPPSGSVHLVNHAVNLVTVNSETIGGGPLTSMYLPDGDDPVDLVVTMVFSDEVPVGSAAALSGYLYNPDGTSPVMLPVPDRPSPEPAEPGTGRVYPSARITSIMPRRVSIQWLS